ncbi:hypothetical protein [Streptococcus pluranimalium]|uniref:hypothetical protein n=1 Tax=Streptococcus pluranimalium TaxID=82348 RepID=UPI0039FD3ECF
MLKRYKANYGFFNQQKKIALLGAITSALVIVPLFILGEDAIPMAMLLINSVIFLLYPNQNRYIVPIK